jgi:dihydrofolate reductase
MRKLSSFLMMSLDGVVEAPDKFVRQEFYSDDMTKFIRETIADQDAVLMGRKQYEEWVGFWPTSTIQPFADFINNTPKFVVSHSLQEVKWNAASLLHQDLATAVAALKSRPGKTIGVAGSISLVQSLLRMGALDEMQFIQFPVIAGSGRRLLENAQVPLQLDLKLSQTTESGMQYLVYKKHE